MYGYIYITTCLMNNKKYIGSHKYNKKEVDPYYYGSGKIFTKAFLKYGRENFTCEILKFCDTREQLIEDEIYFIALYNAVDSDEYYNIDPGRGNSHTYTTDEATKIKLSEAQNKNRTINNGIEQLVVSIDDIDEYLKNGYVTGRLPKDYSERTEKFKSTHYSEEYKDKLEEWKENIRKSVSGRRWVTNGIDDKQIPQLEAEKLVEQGWWYGRVTARGKK